jgi:hypothetical protein
MKKILIAFIALTLTSCQQWLNVNVNPDVPNNASATVDLRLPWIEYYYLYSWGVASVRSSYVNGTITANSTTSANGMLAAWNPVATSVTTPYQNWFIGAACNIPDLISKATAEQAWDYVGAAYTIRAMGYMLMTDWYGDMPYNDAVSTSVTPVFDSGQTIYNGCLSDLNKALSYFNKIQPTTATNFAKGDSWNGGNVQKWIKLIHGLKARWFLNLSKKTSLFQPDSILNELALAPQNVSESIIVNHVNDPTDLAGNFTTGDSYKTSVIYDYAAWSDGARITKWYMNLLTNTFTGGSGVIDPRTNWLVPSAQFTINGVKTFVRDVPVDVINSNIRLSSGPMLSTYSPTTQKWYINTTNTARLGDTVYISLKALSAQTGAKTSESTWQATDGTVISTGTFYTRPESPSHILGYPEMCFIKAEVLFRKGDKAGALLAYQAGIKAHMDLMNLTLATYNTSASINPYKQPIPQSAINAFMTSAAVAQTPDQLTMAKIMQQKFIALSFTQQNWNDMRRFDYSAGDIGGYGVVYTDFDRPYEFGATGATKIPGQSKTDPSYWFRRMMLPSAETVYNSKNVLLDNPHALDLSIWSMPVWWDTAN